MIQKPASGNQYLHNKTMDSNICEIANPTLSHQSVRGTKEDSNGAFPLHGTVRFGTVRYGSVRVGLHFHRSLVPL